MPRHDDRTRLLHGPYQAPRLHVGDRATCLFGLELTAQRADRLLTAAELRQYLDGMQDALAGLDEARVVLAGVVKRMEDGRK